VCLLGPSGCGKSTALRLMGDLLAPTSGSITIRGEAPKKQWRLLAYVFQSPRLVPWRTTLGNVLLGLEMRHPRMRASEARDTALRQLELVGLANDAHKYPSMLSGGERQRTAIARALAVDPDIVLMDEPFSALDPNTRVRLRRELLDIWEATKKTIVFVTHDVDEALFLADRILLFSNKPSRITREMSIDEPRPRNLADDERLAERRKELLDLFGQLETVFQEQHDEMQTLSH
jgi:NitT/TauT family transport system ATP-binding protein